MSELKSCKDCGNHFEYTDSERRFFLERGLDDPKRCAGCRVIRQGKIDKEITCQRCKKSFIYPRELQLYSRSYRWNPPTTCLGGCSDQKYTQDYQLSDFESLASTILGSLTRFLRGESSDRESSHRPKKLLVKPTHSSTSKYKVKGFQDTKVISNQGVEEFLDKYIPTTHQDKYELILFSGKEFQISNTDTFSRGFYDHEKNIIMINKDPLGPGTVHRIKSVITHEIGHAVYFSLSDDVKADWCALSEDIGPVTKKVKIVWNKDELGEIENFA